MRTAGLSAILRCKNEEEFIVSSILSTYPVFDEIIVILNNSTDRTRQLVDVLARDHPKIRLLEYIIEISRSGPNYYEKVRARPESSSANFYNWCTEQTRFSHVCKWDGDMVATREFAQARALIGSSDIVCFDGYDVLGEHTTDLEPRIFKYDPEHARYVDLNFYQALEHNYTKVSYMERKCYVHMKLLKKEWLNKRWSHPMLPPTRSNWEAEERAASSVLITLPKSFGGKLTSSLRQLFTDKPK
jgi:glycosyltransferase involved in cell wall biosynthesis